MTPTLPTSTFREMLEEVIDLSVGFGVAFLPALLLAIPGIILFVVLPGLLLLALALPLAVLAVPPYLLARWLAKRRAAARRDRSGAPGRPPRMPRDRAVPDAPAIRAVRPAGSVRARSARNLHGA
jgi:hypothetical protein